MQQLRSVGRPLLGGALAATALSLQGCQWSIPRHTVPNWLKQESYLREYQVVPSGKEGAARLNSCEDANMPSALQCSGHGRCVEWFDTLPSAAFNLTQRRPSFCKCDREWADPECRTERKSQLTAFLLSLFFGVFGADQFYLGFIWPHGIIKLLTLGGLGVWWIFDVVRIGSTPVTTFNQFKVANDVAHWAYVLTVICAMGLIGFALSIWSINNSRWQKARELVLLHARGPRGAGAERHPGSMGAPGGFSGYGTTLNGSAPRGQPPPTPPA